MANESVNDTDSGVSSSEVTPVNQEVSSMSHSGMRPSSPVEEVRTAGAAALNEAEQLQQLISQIPTSEHNEDGPLDDLDESLVERLLGLTEMFPESLRNAASSLVSSSIQVVAAGYTLSRTVVWCAATTSLLLFAPVLFEVERLNAEEMIKQDRNKLVLGPGSAMSGGPPSGLVPLPPKQ